MEERERGGGGRHQMLGHRAPTRMVEERMKDVSAQGKEKIDHVWMGERTKWDQKDEGVGKMQRDYVGKVKMEI